MNAQLPANLETLSPAEVFSDHKHIETLINEVSAIVDDHTPDIETESGRKEIASLAYSVARSKTYLDDKGKELVSDWKKQAKAVDATRKLWRDRMDEIKAKARAPLDEWEAKEEARKALHIGSIDQLIDVINTAASIDEIDVLDAYMVSILDMESREFEEYTERAESLIPNAKAAIESRIVALQKIEEDRQELERLRKESADREQKEREEKLKREAAEAEREKVEKEKQAAIEVERRESARIEAEKNAAIEAQKKAEDEARQAKIDAERKALEAVEREREAAEAKRLAQIAEAEKREANKKHRAKINNESLACLVEHAGLSEDDAKKVIESIAKRLIENVSISY